MARVLWLPSASRWHRRLCNLWRFLEISSRKLRGLKSMSVPWTPVDGDSRICIIIWKNQHQHGLLLWCLGLKTEQLLCVCHGSVSMLKSDLIVGAHSQKSTHACVVVGNKWRKTLFPNATLVQYGTWLFNVYSQNQVCVCVSLFYTHTHVIGV